MKLTRVLLENFRTFEKAEVDLVGRDGKPLGAALLVGPNGSGKSSILAAIAGVFSFYGGLFGVNYGGEIPQVDDVREGRKKSLLSVLFTDIPLEAGSPSWEARVILSREEGNGLIRGANVVDDLNRNGWTKQATEPRTTGGFIVGLDAHRWLPVQRIEGPNIAQVPRSYQEGALAPTIRWDGQVKPRFGQLHQWLVNIDFRRAKAKADRGEEYPAWDLLRQGLDRLMRPYTFEGVDDDNRAMFRTPNGLVPLERLSDGFRSVFVIVAELMMRLSLAASDQSKMLEGEAVCLIDELDAHLHPNWQLNILPGLRMMFPNVQFIATTHSHLVVSTSKAEEVFYIGPEEDLKP